MLEWNKDLAKVVDNFGDSPLHFAASVEHSRKEVVLGSSFWFRLRGSMYGMTKLLLQANKSSACQPDRNGSFPIHVAASMGRLEDCAGLLDVHGRIFVHVAVEKRRHCIVSFACKSHAWLASVLNMKDRDMNTALHLANAQKWIRRLLAATSVEGTSYRRDWFHEIYTPKVPRMEEINKMTDSTQFLGISSVLIVTITFAAAFAPPGGYIADDRPNRGAQTLMGCRHR
uniref:PGG domain-containing protein n=1 Tax=Leersia perrieri TaxID=77586 RepID=A0A0D9W2Q6_9ORYZ